MTTQRAGSVRPGGRSARVRASVLTAALKAVAEQGYGAVSMEDVAAAAGVHKTTVYRRWPTKADLVIDALLESSRREIPVPDTGSLAGDLTALARTIAASLGTEKGRRTARSLVAASADSPDLADRGEAFWAERLQRLRPIALRGIQRGEIRAGVDPDLILDALLGAVWARLVLTGRGLDDAAIEQIVHLIIAGAA